MELRRGASGSDARAPSEKWGLRGFLVLPVMDSHNLPIISGELVVAPLPKNIISDPPIKDCDFLEINNADASKFPCIKSHLFHFLSFDDLIIA